MQNSRRPLNRLTVTVTISLTLTFDLIFIGGRGIVMDYLCAQFGDFSFSRFGFIMRTDSCRQNHRGDLSSAVSRGLVEWNASNSLDVYVATYSIAMLHCMRVFLT